MAVSSPVSWETAERVATWVGAGRPLGPASPAPRPLDEATWASLRDDFAEATTRAEELVVEATGLRPTTGPAVGQVVDRPEWVRANLVSFRRLLEPALCQDGGGDAPRSPRRRRPRRHGAQLGLVLGLDGRRGCSASTTCCSPRADDDTGGMVSYVGPNIVALERRHAFPPRQFRMWIALHEVTHRCQFTGVPWLRDHFLSLVDEGLSGMPTDPSRLAEALRRAGHAVRSGRNPFEDAGMLGLVAPPEQLEVIGRIQALMSLLEGHGDVTMDRVGGDDVPDAAWFSRVLARAAQERGTARPACSCSSSASRPRCASTSRASGSSPPSRRPAAPALLDRVWEGPENLPSMDEIRHPEQWVARLGTPTVAAG